MKDLPFEVQLNNAVAALRHLLEVQKTQTPLLIRPAAVNRPLRQQVQKGAAAGRQAAAPVRQAVAPGPRPVQNEIQAFNLASLSLGDRWNNLDLGELEKEVAKCQACELAGTRTNTVFGEGKIKPKVMFIGEGPGGEEDKEGRPFVGPAGQLLDKMIAAMTLSRQECYIANVVKCRPPGNKTPDAAHMEACLPYLMAQIKRIQPEFIVLLGAVAAKAMFNRPDAVVGRLRAKVHQWHDIPLVVTYHPAALLREQGYKRPAWEDLKLVMAQLNLGG